MLHRLHGRPGVWVQVGRRVERRASFRPVAVAADAPLSFQSLAEPGQFFKAKQRVLHELVPDRLDAPRLERQPIDFDQTGFHIHELQFLCGRRDHRRPIAFKHVLSRHLAALPS